MSLNLKTNSSAYVIVISSLTCPVTGVGEGGREDPRLQAKRDSMPGGPYPDFHDSTHLAAMRQAFDAAWAVIRAHETKDDKERSQELSVALNATLRALTAEGITDAEQLRNGALQRMPLTAP
jgi:hypothetical protein